MARPAHARAGDAHKPAGAACVNVRAGGAEGGGPNSLIDAACALKRRDRADRHMDARGTPVNETGRVRSSKLSRALQCQAT